MRCQRCGQPRSDHYDLLETACKDYDSGEAFRHQCGCVAEWSHGLECHVIVTICAEHADIPIGADVALAAPRPRRVF